jgi:hypothetical protein
MDLPTSLELPTDAPLSAISCGPATQIILWQLLQQLQVRTADEHRRLSTLNEMGELQAKLMDERAVREGIQAEYYEKVTRLENEKTRLLLAAQNLNFTLQNTASRLKHTEDQLAEKTEVNMELTEDLEASKKQLREEARIKTYLIEQLEHMKMECKPENSDQVETKTSLPKNHDWFKEIQSVVEQVVKNSTAVCESLRKELHEERIEGKTK